MAGDWVVELSALVKYIESSKGKEAILWRRTDSIPSDWANHLSNKALSKILLQSGSLYLRANDNVVHNCVARLMKLLLTAQFPTGFLTDEPFFVKEGVLSADLFFYQESADRPTIFVQIAFQFQSYEMLLLQMAYSFQGNLSIDLAIGVKITEGDGKSCTLEVFIMQRFGIKKIEEQPVEEQEEQRNFFNKDNYRQFPDLFGVSLMFSRRVELHHESAWEDIEIYLGKRHSSFTFSGEDLLRIYKVYLGWYAKDRQARRAE